jgi:hypothetical protein
MRVPRVQFTVRRMIELIIFVALIAALVIQSDRAMRRERELAHCQEVWRKLLDELRDAREVIRRLRLKAKVIAEREVLEMRSKDLGPPKGRNPGAERVPSGRGRDRLEPQSSEAVK